ncbi:MAG: molecular chaperone DnaJ [Nitrospinae bacterium]|nr:molecular chaperone DnaJ [Nitrospinota bacterium]
MKKKTYYEILRIRNDASQSDIKKAYRVLAIKYHPDKNRGNPQAEAKFKEISEAYFVLKDPEKKAKYDRYGNSKHLEEDLKNIFHDKVNVKKIFEQLFKDIFGGASIGNKDKRGSDIRITHPIDFVTAAKGGDAKLKFKRKERCHTCFGSGCKEGTDTEICIKCYGNGKIVNRIGNKQIQGLCPVCDGSGYTIKYPCKECGGEGVIQKEVFLDITIPAGVTDQTTLKYSKEGSIGLGNSDAGDLLIVLKVKPHPVFERKNDDILLTVPINFETAALGGEIEIPTLENDVIVKVPAGTQTHKTLRLKGKGIQNVNSPGKGDQRVQLIVETPTDLTGEERELLKKFAHLRNQRFTPASKNMLSKIQGLFE